MSPTCRFLIRPLENKDADGMLEWMSDPGIAKNFRFDAHNITLESCIVFIKDAKKNKGVFHYAVTDEHDEYLGTISLKNVNTETGSAEYAISMRACAHGSGAAYAGTDAILKLAFDTLHLKRIYLNVLADNERANAFYRKMNFLFQYREVNAVRINDVYHDLNWYAMKNQSYRGTNHDGTIPGYSQCGCDHI